MVDVVTALAALCGALVGFGILVFSTGVRATEVRPRQPREPLASRVDRLSLRVGLATGAGVATLVLTRWPVGALLMAALGAALPSLAGGRAAREAAIARTEAIAAWTEMLRDTMAGAAGIEQAIVATAAVSPSPIREEVVALAARLERERLAVAMREFADALADPAADLVVAALVLASEKQAQRVGELLGTLAAATREQAKMRLRVETGRTRTRTAARVITLFTMGVAAILVLFNRGYLEPYDSAVGQLMLAVVGGCFGGSFWWLAQMGKAAAPERFLLGDHGGAR
ncbi:MAG: pilus assembly protein TadB [Actinobacteria bacterium]|nr:pilus assembly protein TadB [Actinomycetota bacterium]